MTQEAKKTRTKKVTKKQARQEIYQKLASVLSEYKNGKGSKKFDRKLHKASKLFAPYLIKEKTVKKEPAQPAQ
ncbi:MAG: hypothetical protein C5B59_05465 [Bacteroidetes bacterium]|nr:MAG: hypothetical protein C5B59_05465 [Bacteroidota bacterium]